MLTTNFSNKQESHRQTCIGDCYIITLDKHHHANGNLTAVNNGVELPFDIQRTFYIYDVECALDVKRQFHSV